MTIHFEIRDRVGVVTIDRPEVRNAVDADSAAELYEVFRRIDADEAVDVGVLTGAGGTFCAGADLKALADKRGNPIAQLGPEEIVDSMGPMGPTRLAMAKPVIAAVEGHAVAGGLELAVWCDLRVAASDAVFGVYCRRWGVPLIDGGTVRLTRMIGQSHAMDLILTGRPVSGDEALRMGLANRLTEPGAALRGAMELATSITVFPQRCMRSDRSSAVGQWGLSMAEALARESALGVETIRSGETLEGAARFSAGAGRHGSFDG